MIIVDEKLLRVRCLNASIKEAPEIIDKLECELKKSAKLGRPGIGLAAPQIGISLNVAIIRVPSVNNSYNVNLVNCRIIKCYDTISVSEEGCLSFPGKFARTKRYNEIVIIENAVEPHSFVATGLLAICISHEIDHFNGILMFDRMS